MKFKQPDDLKYNRELRSVTREWVLREVPYDGELPYRYNGSDNVENARTVLSAILETRFSPYYGIDGGGFIQSFSFRHGLVGDLDGETILLRRHRDSSERTGFNMAIGDPYLAAANGSLGKRYSWRRLIDADGFMYAQWQHSVLNDGQLDVFDRSYEYHVNRYPDMGEMPNITSDFWEDLKNPDGSFVLWVHSSSGDGD